jgi:hypothetical protein
VSLDLHVDRPRWEAHLRRVLDGMPDGTSLVPVIKGNGYGFGVDFLAREAAALGVATVAVGTYAELAAVEAHFPGDLLVLEPWRPEVPVTDQRVIHTVSRAADLDALGGRGSGVRIVVEQATSMHRFGFDVALADVPADVRLEGAALHLPMVGDTLAEARSRATGLPGPLWVSHLAPPAAATLSAQTGHEVRLRAGTMLWLGDRSTLTPRARVLEVHRLERGERFGYRQRRAPGGGALIVVSGGTAHGIAMEAPKPPTGLRSRAVAATLGGLEALGRNLSPYTWNGRKLWFAEPPHMQVSLLWVPRSVPPPAVGDELDVDVRFTTTTFDHVLA